MKRVQIKIQGVVQGVGFRPFIFGVAKKFNLKGFVTNTDLGVLLEFEGKKEDIEASIKYIKTNKPKAAAINNMEVAELEMVNYKEFRITESKKSDLNKISISPDLSICKDCLNDMQDSNGRFFDYPFTSCSNCGPRYSIINEIPYDRINTSMNHFDMCDECKAEYTNPDNRRYHAQTIACPNCGPHYDMNVKDIIDNILNGKIIALKGMGGYHLVCDAKNDNAVLKLRERKNRPSKPFAVMMNHAQLQLNCYISENEEELITEAQAPILLLKQKKNSKISKFVNPGVDTLGVMLPYAGIHEQILSQVDTVVMTSANISNQPIIIDEENAKELNTIADVIVNHNREITNRCDDSVVRCVENKKFFIRRSRGYIPTSINLYKNAPDILACGGDLKNTFSIYKGGYAYISQYIGDLEDKNTFDFYVRNIEYFKKLLSAKLQYVICDYHHGYHSTAFAKSLGLETIPVQHHYAHIASVMAENNIYEDVIGVSFDGTGLGDDGNLWGGEFFIANSKGYKRTHHFNYVKLPGEIAVKEPWRMGLSYLYSTFNTVPDIEFISKLNINPDIYKEILKKEIYPVTSSVGRLFDAVSSIIGINEFSTYEAQAAIEMEAISYDTNELYNFEIKDGVINTILIIQDIVKDCRAGISKDMIASKFHNTISEIILKTSLELKNMSGINRVLLSGGVFQNHLLLSQCIKKLESCGFIVNFNTIVPINDGGISLGQTLIALEKINS